MDYKQHIKNLLIKNKEGIFKTNKNKSVVVLIDILDEIKSLKENGYKESIRLSKEYDLYRQDWCGCEFSLKEHEEKIKNQKNN